MHSREPSAGCRDCNPLPAVPQGKAPRRNPQGYTDLIHLPAIDRALFWSQQRIPRRTATYRAEFRLFQ